MSNQPIDFLGQGLAFPPRVGTDGRLAWSVGEDNIRESMRLILMTAPAERLMREEFGCGLRSYLFEPNTVATQQRIREDIVNSLGRWEPRISVDDVSIVTDSNDPTRVAVSISYRLVATQELAQLGLSLQLEA